jgi:hypothetical protein
MQQLVFETIGILEVVAERRAYSLSVISSCDACLDQVRG